MLNQTLDQTPTTRDELYTLIWSRPLSQVAVYLNTTMPLIRKACMEYQIPMPDSDFWRHKDKHGWTPKPLSASITNTRRFDLNDILRQVQASLLFQDETANSFSVPPKLVDPDDLIVAAKKSLQEDTLIHYTTKMKRIGFEYLPVSASVANIDRALLIMDTLVKCWRKRGYEIRVQFKRTDVLIRKVWQRISLREITKKIDEKDSLGFSQYEATGVLALKVNAHPDREWRDGKLRLEDQLLDILNHMEVGAQELEAIWARSAERQKQEQIKEQLRKETIKTDATELDAFEILVKEASRWQELRTLREYLEELYKVTPHTPTFLEWYRKAVDRTKVFNPIHDRIKLLRNIEDGGS